jgi:predicted esterase
MLANIGRARLILPEGEHESTVGSGHKWWTKGVKAAVEHDPEGAAVEWQAASDRMAEFLRQIVQCRPTVGQPILTGSSQGGEMTLLMASTHPELARSGVAVSSYLLEPFWNRRLSPTAMLHGTGDTTVPYIWARDYADEMRRDGAPLEFFEYESPGHAVTRPMSRGWIATVRGEVEKTSASLAA